MGGLSGLSGKKLHLDANLFIYHIEQTEPFATFLVDLWKMLEAGKAQATTSEVTLAECLAGPFRMGREDLIRIYSEIIRDRPGLGVTPVSREVLIEAASLRARHQALRLPDAIHAATAILNGCDLLLTNDKHFSGLERPRVLLLSELMNSTA